MYICRIHKSSTRARSFHNIPTTLMVFRWIWNPPARNLQSTFWCVLCLFLWWVVVVVVGGDHIGEWPHDDEKFHHRKIYYVKKKRMEARWHIRWDSSLKKHWKMTRKAKNTSYVEAVGWIPHRNCRQAGARWGSLCNHRPWSVHHLKKKKKNNWKKNDIDFANHQIWKDITFAPFIGENSNYLCGIERNTKTLFEWYKQLA